MSLKDILQDELKDALRSGDKTRLSTVRMVLSAIKYAEIDKGGALEEPDILGVISKEARRRQESIDAYKQGNRPDLVAQESAELAILRKYLPQQISREEIIVAARQVIAEVGATGPQDKGKVMSKLIAQLKGKAEGKDINAVVTELLAAAVNR